MMEITHIFNHNLTLTCETNLQVLMKSFELLYTNSRLPKNMIRGFDTFFCPDILTEA